MVGAVEFINWGSTYSGTSPYGHLTSHPGSVPNCISRQITPCNKVTSQLRSLVPSPVGDPNSEVPLYTVYE